MSFRASKVYFNQAINDLFGSVRLERVLERHYYTKKRTIQVVCCIYILTSQSFVVIEQRTHEVLGMYAFVFFAVFYVSHQITESRLILILLLSHSYAFGRLVAGRYFVCFEPFLISSPLFWCAFFKLPALCSLLFATQSFYLYHTNIHN